MTDDARTNDSINPITALAFVEDQGGGLSLLLAGEGPNLKVFDYRSARLIAIKKIFETQAIHGINAINVSTHHERFLDGIAEVLLWGGRCVRLGLLRHGLVAGPLPIEVELKAVLTLDDWILDGCLNPQSGADSESLPRQFYSILVTAHNVAYALLQNDEKDLVIKQIAAGPDSMLYSAHIEYIDNAQILVASGTVFGNIFVWSFSGTAVNTRAASQASIQLHYKFTGHDGSIFGVRLSPKVSGLGFGDAYRLLVSCSDDRTIRLWDITDCDVTKSLQPPDKDQKKETSTRGVATVMGHASRIWSVHFLVSGDRINVLSSGEDGTTQVWQLTQGDPGSSSHRSKDPGTISMNHRRTYAYHCGKNIWATALAHPQNRGRTICTGGADGRIVRYHILDEHRSIDGQVSTGKWTMRDVAVQLADGQTSSGSDAASSGRSTHKTVCEHVFDALGGTWTIERDIKSALPTSPSGTFSGEAQFESRPPAAKEFDKEYLYIENGKFTTDQGPLFAATRHYVYRYQQASDLMSAWFVKPDGNTVVDYLFHEVRLDGSNDSTIHDSLPVNGVIKASSYHLCIKDHYTPTYDLHLVEGRLHDWRLTYQVKGPQKDYVAEASYTRPEKELLAVQKTRTPGGQILPKSQIKEDSLRSYVFLADGSLLVTTAHGKVLIKSLLSSAESEREADQDVGVPGAPQAHQDQCTGDRRHQHLSRYSQHPDVVHPKRPTWKLIGQYEALRSSSIIKQAEASNIVVLSGTNGHIFFYDSSKSEVVPILDLKTKIAFFYAQELCTNHLETRTHFILAVCLGLPVAYVYQISDGDHRGDDVVGQGLKLTLPACFIVTSSCYLTRLRLWVLGSRTGVLAIYDESAARDDRALEACSILTGIHGQDAITVIKCLPDRHEKQPPYILTAGRDGHYAVHRISIATARYNETLVDRHTIHRSTPPFGPNIEGAAFDRQTRNLILWGFQSKEFVVWNASKDMETMRIDCGGAHRNWCYTLCNDGNDGGTFVWTKASEYHVHSQLQASHKVISPGGHGREIKAMGISPALENPDGTKLQYIATGSEDTTIRMWSYSAEKGELGSGFRCLGYFKKHTTGIQQLRWSDDSLLLFSAAGCEEFFVWRVQPVPLLGIGAVCEAVCPKVTDDGDLRVMDFAIAEASRYAEDDENQAEKFYVISTVYSDSSLRVGNLFLLSYGRHLCTTRKVNETGLI